MNILKIISNMCINLITIHRNRSLIFLNSCQYNYNKRILPINWKIIKNSKSQIAITLKKLKFRNQYMLARVIRKRDSHCKDRKDNHRERDSQKDITIKR